VASFALLHSDINYRAKHGLDWLRKTECGLFCAYNCSDDKVNNITSNGAEFNYVVRNYGVSQKVIDGVNNPINPLPV